jgi:histidyl-tRNA synthetase
MNKPQNIKGMRDHLPEALLLRQQIINTLTTVFERHGFEPLQTPTLEYAEVLDGKLGDDEKLIYRFEDHGGRKLALRYDQTVPLARVVAQYAAELQPRMPWRRYSVGQSYRGERPARGRYREFTQADVDIIGTYSPLADAEIIAVLTEGLAALGFTDFVTMIGHRQLIGGIARLSGLDETTAGGVYRAIDKLDKLGAAGVRTELLNSGVQAAAADQILASTQIEGAAADVLDELAARLATDERASAAVTNLRAICAALAMMGVPAANYRVAPRLARGLSYYTGVVFEAITPHWPEGSLLGGGRYDDLLGLFAGRAVPAVGLAFGVDRLHDVMEELKIGARRTSTATVFVTIFGPEQQATSLALATELRAAGVNVATSLEPGKLGKQFQEADRKGAHFALVIGPDEAAADTVVVKDLRTGTQQTVARAAVTATVSA